MIKTGIFALIAGAFIAAGLAVGDGYMAKMARDGNMDNMAATKTETRLATFGAGCFWHVEEAFRHVDGVVSTRVGFMGGRTTDPTYKDVCSHTTGHAEVVEVTYDPAKVSYERLLDVFWHEHDPTQVNRQGPDVGDQYRSVIFYHDEGQKKAAEASKAALDKSGKYSRPIATEITETCGFYMAEEYHQQYLEKHGRAACRVR